MNTSCLLAAWLAVGSLPAAASAQLPDPPPTVTFRGRVVDSPGKPMAGVGVLFTRQQEALTAAALLEPTVRTGADGRFEVVAEPGDGRWTHACLHIAQRGFAAVLITAAPKYDREQKQYETERDLGNVVLIPGTRLFGRVRDDAGRPVRGARVVATDLLEHSRMFRGPSFHVSCAVLSDDSGIFDLQCALPQAVTLVIDKEGCYAQRLSPVATGTPLEVTLAPSGFILGRILDGEGRGVEGADVATAYEVRGRGEATRSAADGSFRLTVAQPGRYRISASHKQGDAVAHGTSEVLEGPRGNLEIVLAAPEAKAGGDAKLLVKALDKKTGLPVAQFDALSVFDQYANQNANYLENRLRQSMRTAVVAEQGVAKVSGPANSTVTTGVVRVLAPGYAVATKKEVEWRELGENETREPITVELLPESRLSGKVLDEITGEAVAGAKVWARPQQDRSQGYYNEGAPPPEAVTSGADGTFTIGQLPEGGHELFVRHTERPNVPPLEFEIGGEEHKADFEARLPAGAPVGGKLVGAEVGPGWKVFLQALPEFSPTGGGYSRVMYTGEQEPEGAVEVTADGSFEFRGMKLADYRLVLMVPSPPRCGGHVYVPLEPFRLRRSGLHREFDISQDRPGTFRGRITFPETAIGFERLVVTARAVADDQNMVFFNPYQNQWPGPRAFVSRGGDFELPMGPGRYQLEVVDIGTGIRLCTSENPLALAAGGTAQCDLAPRLLEVVIKIEPEGEGPRARADRLETRLSAADQKNQVRMAGGNDNHDFGVGVDLLPDQTEVRLVLPPGDLVLFLRNSCSQVRVDNQRHNPPPLARAEFEVSADKNAPREVAVKLPAPPEIPAGDAPEKKNGDADGQ